jgi:hypothetical protein
MVKKLVIFFMLAIVVLLGGCYSEVTDVKEETVEQTVVDKYIYSNLKSVRPMISEDEYYLTLGDGQDLEVSEEIYNEIKVGGKVILYYSVYYKGEKYLGSELKKIEAME